MDTMLHMSAEDYDGVDETWLTELGSGWGESIGALQ
jgi:hypothetical protein